MTMKNAKVVQLELQGPPRPPDNPDYFSTSETNHVFSEPQGLLPDAQGNTTNNAHGATTAHPSKGAQTSTRASRLVSEILSLAIATVCLVGLVILLKRYEKKASPEWSLGSWGITLNTVVSIVSTIFRATLLMPVANGISQFGWIWYTQPRSLQDLSYYDSASRGPFGSMLLLFKLRFIRFASLGAFIMLTALALDPFFQQSVRYVANPAVDLSQKAQATTAYTWGEENWSWGEFVNAYSAVPYDMKAAIYNGLLTSNALSLPEPPFICPTGNCTWDQFGTLAVDSQCEDLSSLVELNDDQGFAVPNDTLLHNMVNGSGSYDLFYIEAGLPQQYSSVMTSFLNMTGVLAIVQWVKATGPTDRDPVSSKSTLEAARCVLYFSAKEVLPSVANGVYSEQVLQEVVRSEPLEGLSYDPDTPFSFFASVYGDWSSIVYKLNDEPPNRNYTFVVPFQGFAALSSNLATYSDLLTGKAGLESGGNVVSGDSIPTMLYMASNTTQAMYNLASAITTQMRANGSNTLTSTIAPDQAIDGSVWIQEQRVLVKWDWLILPIALLVFSIIFLLATFLETRRSNIGLWLSSPLTLYFHARREDQDLGWETDSLGTASAMRKAASKLTARIPRHARGTIEIYQSNSGDGPSPNDIRLLPRDSLEMNKPA